eukprot:gene1101-15436_t
MEGGSATSHSIDPKVIEMSLFIDKLKLYGRDPRIRPSQSATNITLQIALIAVGPISMLTTSVRCDVILRQWWTDPRTAFDNKTELNFNGNPSHLIWTPDSYVTNAIKISSPKGITENTRTKIGPNGAVYLSTRLTVEVACNMNFHMYPMDKQECSLNLESYAYTAQEMRLRWRKKSPIEIEGESLSVSEYKIVSIKAVTASKQYLGTQNFDMAKLTIKFSRLLPNYIYHIYLPGIFLVLLSFCTFWIPEKAVPARVTLIVTNFLTTMFLFGNIGNSVPKVPYITALEVFALVNAIWIIGVMLEYVFILRFPEFGKKGLVSFTEPNGPVTEKNDQFWEKPDTDKALKIFKGCIAQVMAQKAGNKGPHIVDKFSRIIFPITYSSYLIAYFAYCFSRD